MITQKALDLIIKYEVGGGESYYNKFLRRPTFPGNSSGVTIGIGYDLGYESIQPWETRLPAVTVNRLRPCAGKYGLKANALIPSLRDIIIPWAMAVDVFHSYTLPRHERLTGRALPGFDKLHPDVQGALVSLCFNRGTSMTGDRRREMRDIRGCVAAGDVQGIADAIYEMKRLWPDTKGLRYRRDAEAALILSTLENK